MALIRLLAAAEDMRHTASLTELRAYEQAAKRIRSKLVEHLEFCGEELKQLRGEQR